MTVNDRVRCVYCENREGIQFAMNTQSYPFLEILCEFSGKLMKQDKKVVCVDFIVLFRSKTPYIGRVI